MHKDDGQREGVYQFLFEHREEKLPEFISLLSKQGEYWKARILLELVWSIQECPEAIELIRRRAMEARKKHEEIP